MDQYGISGILTEKAQREFDQMAKGHVSDQEEYNQDTDVELMLKILQTEKKAWRKIIIPISLVPFATAQAMLLTGTHKRYPEDCHFPLPTYLLATGTISLAMVVLAAVSQWIVNWNYEILQEFDRIKNDIYNPDISTREKIAKKVWTMKQFWRIEKRIWILEFLHYTKILSTVTQFILLCIGTVIIIPHASHWQHADKNAEEYCERGMMIFSLIYLGLTWIFLILGIICMSVLIIAKRIRRKKAMKNENIGMNK